MVTNRNNKNKDMNTMTLITGFAIVNMVLLAELVYNKKPGLARVLRRVRRKR